MSGARPFGDGLLSAPRLTMVGAGFAIGALEKLAFVQSLPSLPLLGKTGTLAVASYFVSDEGRNEFADDVCTAALTVAGYMLGSTGSIVGDSDDNGFDTSGYVAGF